MSPRAVDKEKLDILGADKALHEELEEAHATPDADRDPGEDTFDLALMSQFTTSTEPPAELDFYLSTINRKALDFDFEKVCSVSNVKNNIYACLVCGKYFSGRKMGTPAYEHAWRQGHHVFVSMNPKSKKVWILPDLYEVKDPSLDDIKIQVDPQYTREQVMKLDKVPITSYTLDRKEYDPGFIGINEQDRSDYVNVVVQALSHVEPIRNYFLLTDFTKKPELVKRFSLLVRKLWNPQAFKAQTSPNELFRAISNLSEGPKGPNFKLGEQADPAVFLTWFLNHLHQALGGTAKPGSSLIHLVFQGRLQDVSEHIHPHVMNTMMTTRQGRVEMDIVHYMVLPLHLPMMPVFVDKKTKEKVIPQTTLADLLHKFNGERKMTARHGNSRFRLKWPLPPYLIFHIQRFEPNRYFTDRNHTIVNFSPDGLDMAPYIMKDDKTHVLGEPVIYDMVCNVFNEITTHGNKDREKEEDRNHWGVHVRDWAHGDWKTIKNLENKKSRGEAVDLEETYIQVWKRRPEKGKRKAKRVEKEDLSKAIVLANGANESKA
jgi:U4/U6.U5 tri-snRNP-associated protein 2